MSSLTNYFFKTYLQKKYRDVTQIIEEPLLCQKKHLQYLLNAAQHTEWGKTYNYKNIQSYEQYAENVPINTYESIYPFIERCIKGESNVLWRGKTRMFSKSSGTSGSKSKFIPVTWESLIECNYKGGKESLALYVKNRPDTRLFTGKTLSLTGSLRELELNPKAVCGDMSAVLIKYIPEWANRLRTPPKHIALHPDWNLKLDQFANHTKKQNITGLAGVPSWILIILKRIMEMENIDTIQSIWTNLELFMHGGVNFSPYEPQFKAITNNDKLWYWQMYNASEGYFATQDRPHSQDMLLLLNNGVFFEFIALTDYMEENYKTISLEDVKTDTNYVLLISTNAGLWRYIIGDVIKFTSTNPYRIIITGRNTHFINAFGEELILDNVEKALAKTCQQTYAIVNEYTVAPIYFSDGEKASHEWLIEFKQTPENMEQFTNLLDKELMKVNSDYEAKRTADILLQKPIIQSLPQGTFLRWMSSKNKLGGQYKVIRLSNNRDVIEDIKKFIS